MPEEIQEFKISFKSLMYELQHSRKILEIATRIASQVGLSRDEIKNLQIVASLHDIGMMDIPDHVMFKQGALTHSEYVNIKLHVSRSTELLRSMGFGDKVISSIEAHHESYGGGGYPKGLVGKEIPLGARIIAVADAYNALTSEHSYRPALTSDQAIKTLKEESGTMFDPDIVEALTQASKNQAPIEDLTEGLIENNSFIDLFHVLLAARLTTSQSQARRLLNQSAIEVDGKKVTSNIAPVHDGSIIKVGKRRFVKIVDSD
jgi:putative nucleotidyltransferase with HDIG domain